MGQSMVVKATRSTDLDWTSVDVEGKPWFESSISLYDFSAVDTSDKELSEKLKKIFKSTVRLNCEFLDKWNAFKVETKLEFPRDWGLGSSSTLIALIAQWADIEPLELYYKVENGSGYDVAAAVASGPILFWSTEEEVSFRHIDFKPKFADQLLFVHLNKKADSPDAVKAYYALPKSKKSTFVKEINMLTDQIASSTTRDSFAKLLDQHEEVVSKVIGMPTIKSSHFSDFDGTVKSLGAWGGDFILATSEQGIDYVKSYFASKGFNTQVGYKDMVL